MQLKTRTADAAVGRWSGILQGLGIDAKFLANKHGPCPMCGGTDRFRFDDKDGRGTWYCSHCGAGDGFTMLRVLNGWDFTRAAKEVDAIMGTVQAGRIRAERTTESKVQALRKVWSESRAVTRGDPVWMYLNRRTDIQDVPPELRFHPGLKHSDGGVHPCMLAMMRYPDGKAASIHRTYLTEGGEKAAVSQVKKFMAGHPLQTASVRLSDVRACIGIAEGVETALAASLRFQMPVWAATNAVLLEAWAPPEGVEHVLVAGDNDLSYTGQSAAFALARRLTGKGLTVDVWIPEAVDTDWADA
jgi:putative DNA primase/helicase